MTDEYNGSVLKQYMTAAQRKALGKQPTYHTNCIDACGVARPGKTARDRARREGKIKQDYSTVAQLVEHPTDNRKADGSIPSCGTK